MTNGKEPRASDASVEKSADEDSNTANQTSAVEEHSDVDISLPAEPEDDSSNEISQEYSSMKTELEVQDTENEGEGHLECISPRTDLNTQEQKPKETSEVFSSSLPTSDGLQSFQTEMKSGVDASIETIDSGIFRSSRSLERTGSSFERDDTVPELNQCVRLGSDYTFETRRQSNSTIESFSDDEIEENYLGNIPAHKRRSGVFICPVQETEDIAAKVVDDECGSYIGVKRIRQEITAADDYDSSKSFGVKRVQQMKTEQNGDTGGVRKARQERWSCGSVDSAASKAESTVSFCDTLAAHVRKDSIAMSLEKMQPVRSHRRRSSVTFADIEGLINKAKMHKSKRQLVSEYRLHLFVSLIFIVTVSFVSVGWFVHSEAVQALVVSQKIFFDPRSRKLTLHSEVDGDEVTGYIGLNIPRWQLPLHCPIREEGNPNAKECIWKKNAILRISYYVENSIQCYNVSWEYLNPNTVPMDCFEIGNSIWFGSSNLTSNIFPIVGNFSYDSNSYRITGNGVFSEAVEYYWLSSNSHAILFHSDIPLHISWNNIQPGRLCLVSNYSSPFYTRSEKGLPPFNYTVCNGHDMVQTHIFMRSMFASPSKVKPINTELMQNPWWSVYNESSENISEKNIMNMALNIKNHSLNCSALVINGRWQNREGDLDFDLSKFSNVSEMMSVIKSAKCSVSVSVSAHFDYGSSNFKDGIENNYFVMDAGGEVPGLTRLYSGVATVLDVTKSTARDWFTSKLAKLSSLYGINTFSFSYGSESWLPHYPHFKDKQMSPNKLRKLYSEMVASVSDKLSMQMTSQSQHVHAFLPVKSLITATLGRTCISGSIPAALTTGLLGYPYLFLDGFTVTSEVSSSATSSIPSRDIYIRWLQLSAFFPAVKYSVPPWAYDDTVVDVARNMSRLHQQHVLPIIKDHIDQQIREGMPILRPVWWLSPANKTAMDVSDEFLVGDQLLVAPILCEGQRSRDIFFPRGIWADSTKGGLTVGPRLVSNYSVKQFEVPYFIRMKVTHD